ncbi:MAG: anthranilate phosphoribosyltransferase [Kiritimatiellaeota bacterium]|nr:anthranilate phosphoribosyltransferase [Kiritimatiellota bacterium]
MFLLIDNYDSFTYNLVQAFYTLGHDPVVKYNDDPAILELAAHPDLKMVCISPGPSDPAHAGHCLEFLARLPHHIPVLGVCLGHQILGAHAGAEVVRAPYIMHGKASEVVHDGMGLFKGLDNPMLVGRYHSLLVKDHPGFQVNARGPEGEVMALRYHDRPWVGVQFHPESVLTPKGLKLLENFPSAILPEEQGDIEMKTVLSALAQGKDLTSAMASYAFAALIDGKLPLVQAGSFLMGLRMKGESAIELAQAARVALSRAIRVEGIEGDSIDIVGTGGDGRDSFNCSTATALTLAGMGHQVVKHGNRAITSKSGSADVLERLGLPINTLSGGVKGELQKRNFAFLYAPLYHPVFSLIAPIRKDLAMRTIFNLLGPLLNPARPSHLLIGVAQERLLPLMADALRTSHVRCAAVVHGAGGYDEVSPLGISKVIFLHDGRMSEAEINPADYGIALCAEADLRVDSVEHAERLMRDFLDGRATRPIQDMVTLNVGVALHLLNPDRPLATCMAQAREAVAGATGRKVLAA